MTPGPTMRERIAIIIREGVVRDVAPCRIADAILAEVSRVALDEISRLRAALAAIFCHGSILGLRDSSK